MLSLSRTHVSWIIVIIHEKLRMVRIMLCSNDVPAFTIVVGPCM
ncbi:MAG: hypothetical protein QOF66_3392 [Mycobacterium sp.]|jgi:hypothetical protein|nr:hypothetical protein [Mycobacterium sp.]